MLRKATQFYVTPITPIKTRFQKVPGGMTTFPKMSQPIEVIEGHTPKHYKTFGNDIVPEPIYRGTIGVIGVMGVTKLDSKMTTIDRALAYVAKMPAAISGRGGHAATFAVAKALVHGFALSESQAWPILLDYNKRCQPPWSEAELRHKLKSAGKLDRPNKPRGHLW